MKVLSLMQCLSIPGPAHDDVSGTGCSSPAKKNLTALFNEVVISLSFQLAIICIHYSYCKRRNIGDTLNLAISQLSTKSPKLKTTNINVARTNVWPSVPQTPN